MARKVKGFQAEDGRFFETKAEAEYYEARSVVEGLELAEVQGGFSVTEWIEANHEEVERFIKAIHAKRGVAEQRRVEDEYAENEEHETDNGEGEEDAPSVEQFEAGGDKYLPDMGRRIRSEEIRNKRTQHVPRSRKGPARGIRGRKDLATRTPAETTKAR